MFKRFNAEGQYCVVYVSPSGRLAHICDERDKLAAKVEEFRESQEACLIDLSEKPPFVLCDSGAVISKLILKARA